ncbi:MAG: hypothetical protein WDW38_002758 [Sanguina aurantia]
MATYSSSISDSAWFRGLVTGPIAGLCSRLVVYPADTIKARLQVQGAIPHQGSALPYRNTLHAMQQIATKEGFLGFYRGFSAVALGSIPANMAFFSGYELGKVIVPGQGVATDICVGAIAQLVGSVVFTPVDVIKERMQVQAMMRSSYSYTGPLHAIECLVKERGVTGLLKGYWATNVVWVPWSALYLAGYELAKTAAAKSLGTQDGASSSPDSIQPPSTLPVPVLFACSAAAASAAAVLTHPMDVVKTRLQVLSASTSVAAADLTSWSVFRQLAAEGPRALLTSGLTARILTLAPGTAISWVVYDIGSSLFKSQA